MKKSETSDTLELRHIEMIVELNRAADKPRAGWISRLTHILMKRKLRSRLDLLYDDYYKGKIEKNHFNELVDMINMAIL